MPGAGRANGRWRGFGDGFITAITIGRLFVPAATDPFLTLGVCANSIIAGNPTAP